MGATPKPGGTGPRGGLLALLFCTAIAAFSSLPGWSYLLFPELAALSSSVFEDPWGPWARRPWMLILLPTLAAVAGLWISLQSRAGGAAVLLAVLVAKLLLVLFRSPLVPALSAAVLPVLLGVRSWAYPVQIAIGLVSLTALLWWMRRGQVGPGAGALPAPGPPPWRGMVVWSAYLGVLLLAGPLFSGLHSGLTTLLLPPLIVISHEALVSPSHSSWRQRPWLLPPVCGAAALIGVLAARLFSLQPALATVLILLACRLLLLRLHLRLPPIYALGMLPLLLPRPGSAFVLAALIGSGSLALICSGLVPTTAATFGQNGPR